MKRIFATFLLLITLHTSTHSRSQQSILPLPSFQEALSSYREVAVLLQSGVFRSVKNPHTIESAIKNRELDLKVGNLLLKEADSLLREKPFNEYKKKVLLTIIALLKEQKNEPMFQYHQLDYTVTVKNLIENTQRKLHGKPLVPPHIW